MLSARYLLGLVCVAAIGCGESDRMLGEGTLANEATADGGRVLEPSDMSTDPPVSLLGIAGTGAAQSAPPMNGGNTAEPDAGRADSDEGASTDPDDGSNAGSGGQGGGPEPMTEPEPPEGDAAVDDNGGLIGTVCDLLGGLLCPVGLLCVEGSCQEPPAS